jgi:hypothetical protein
MPQLMTANRPSPAQIGSARVRPEQDLSQKVTSAWAVLRPERRFRAAECCDGSLGECAQINQVGPPG